MIDRVTILGRSCVAAVLTFGVAGGVNAAMPRPAQVIDLRADDARFASYTGRGTRYAIVIANDNLDRDVTEFPEPPLVVRRLGTGASCSIDGGIWVRGGFRFARGETRLITHEYSGSSDDIVVYRTADCQLIGRAPLPARAWAATDRAIVIGIDCRSDHLTSCRRHRTIVYR